MFPHEWRAARSAFKDLHSEVKKHREAGRQAALGFLLPLLAGGALGWWLLPPAIASNDHAALLAVAAGVLAFAAILIGFVVTLMLGTGRLDLPDHVQFEEVVQHIERTRYLLYSQAVTLFAAILLCGLIVLWSLMVAGKFDAFWLRWIGSLTAGFTGICLLRSMFLPLQIWEFHQAAFKHVLDTKKKQSDDKYAR